MRLVGRAVGASRLLAASMALVLAVMPVMATAMVVMMVVRLGQLRHRRSRAGP
jgi:hypothetical protein